MWEQQQSMGLPSLQVRPGIWRHLQLTCRKKAYNILSIQSIQTIYTKIWVRGEKVSTFRHSLCPSHTGRSAKVPPPYSLPQSTLGPPCSGYGVRLSLLLKEHHSLRRESKPTKQLAEQSLTQVSTVELDSKTSLVPDSRDSGQMTSKVSFTYTDIPFPTIPWMKQSYT